MRDHCPVELHAVSFAIDTTQLIQDVSLCFLESGINVILGPNGAGKSTLMRIAAGRQAPTTGQVAYEGRNVRELDPRALALRRAFLSQRITIDFAITVEEVVQMGRYPHFNRVPRARDQEVVEEALALVGMASRRRQPYPTLSGGEQQKVQLARVLAQIWSDGGDSTHRILFLDEPITGLDIHYQLHIMDIARDFLRRNCTIVTTLHDLNIAVDYGDRFFLMQRGALAHVAEKRQGLAREVIERVFDVRVSRLQDESGRSSFRFFL
jgi:iron complex transport system ATP-binding protein